MSHIQHSILLDTNIWIDFYLRWRDNSELVSRLIELAMKNDFELLYAAHSVKDVFYLINAELKRAARQQSGKMNDSTALAAKTTSWACIENMCENASAIGADNSDIWLARKYRQLHDDLEDNLILAAAQRADVDFIVTSDKALLQKSTVAAHTPQDAVALLELQLNAG